MNLPDKITPQSPNLTLWLAFLLVSIVGARAQDYLAIPDYRNAVYDPRATIPNTSLIQTPSVAIFSGNVGAAANSSTPNDGLYRLVRSVIGQAVAGQPARIPGEKVYRIGELFIPPVALGVRSNVAPASIEPPEGAEFIPNGLDRTVATSPGFVSIKWIRNDSSVNSEVRYNVLDEPVQDPVVLYHTHLLNGDLSNNIAPINKVPKVTIPSTVQVQLLHNPALPDPTVVQFNTLAGEMRAKSSQGYIVLVYRNASGAFQSLEVVQVKANVPSGSTTLADIGFPLTPYINKPNSTNPIVSAGLNLQTPELAFVYQHQLQPSSQYGQIFAIRRTSVETDIEVYWRRKDSQSVAWPYELHHYTANWPSDPTKFQRYVRGSTAVKGPDVILQGLNAVLMPFQEPTSHAQTVSLNTFQTINAGWALLKYSLPNNTVSFQVVRSVLHNDASQFVLALSDRSIGAEITDPSHQGPRAGYIHAPEGNRYDWETYEGTAGNPPGWDSTWTTKQIFAVNKGTLEVWWSNVNPNGGVQWPSLVKRYNAIWPVQPERITIASQKGTGPITVVDHQNFRVYFQNDPTRAGFNPNDEHAFKFTAFSEQQGAPEAVFALRDDLWTDTTSEPYVLLKYRTPTNNLRWAFRVFRVLAEGLGSDGINYAFNYPATAGVLIQLPYPLSYLNFVEGCDENMGVSGPWWRDRKKFYWAKAAGNNGGTAQIVMRYFYSTNVVIPGPYFPSTKPAVSGPHVAWLDRRPGGTPGRSTDVTNTVSWPPVVPELRVAETLAKAKSGLPGVHDATSVEIIYQQSATNRGVDSVTLIDPTRDPTGERPVPMSQLPTDVPDAIQQGNYYFTTFPPQLRKRLWYDPVHHLLRFKGDLIEPVAGDYYLLLNVITERERTALRSTTQDPVFLGALNKLFDQSTNVTVVPPNTFFDSLALTAGLGRGTGYVTIAFNNSTLLNEDADSIRLSVFRVNCPLYEGELKIISSDNPFDEKLTLRHSGDFAGRAEEYQFEWRTLPPINGGPDPRPYDQWNKFATTPPSGFGALDITIQGPGLYTLSDNWFVSRYRATNTNCPCGTNSWSPWTKPMLAEGWIKRVLAGINPFDQRYKNFESHAVNTIISMVSQAGPRPVGATPLNAAGAANYGLIEIYGTVLDRGRKLSVEGAPAVDYGPANDSLILVASRISKLYMLLGNEAYADATDPTIAYGTDSGDYGAQASSVFCFQNQLGTLLDEELALLRGRDDSQLPAVTTPPFYNKLIWNFTRGDGEVAYVANYGIRDRVYQDPNTGDVDNTRTDGVINGADAKVEYPQGHGDAWGHYLTALAPYYRLLRNTNFTWIPRSEAIIVGGVPVSVDYQDERQFAGAAAAKAKAGAEIAGLSYRSAYVEDPAGQWQGYQDANTNRAWGVSEWASRAGQGAYLDWVMGNALLPATYQQSWQINENTLNQTEPKAAYYLSDTVLTNIVPLFAPDLTPAQVASLRAMPGRVFLGRQSIIAALDGVLGIEARLRYQSAILSAAQTNGLPEQVFTALEILKGNQYATERSLTNALMVAMGTNTFLSNYSAGIRPYVAMPPPGETPAGIKKIDRSTVPELREVAAAYVNVQEQLDKADSGLNPLGLAKNALPFDINPQEIDQGTTHFEQIYLRAIRAMNNAISVFNYAFNSSQLLRKQADSALEFGRSVDDREADFNSRLIEAFGYPYSDDIGPTGSYPSGYDGPDLYHFMYVESSPLLGGVAPPIYEVVVQLRELRVDPTDGAVSTAVTPVKYHVAANGFGLVKPASWTGQRRAPGEIQLAHLDLLQTKARFDRSLVEYENLFAQIESQAVLLKAGYKMNEEEITILNSGQGIQTHYNDEIQRRRERQLNWQTAAQSATILANAIAEALPQDVIVGVASGGDFTSIIRSAIRLTGGIASELLSHQANRESLAELDQQQAKELAQSQQNIRLTVLRQDQAIDQQLAQLEQLVRQEAPLRLEIYNLQEALRQSAGRYAGALARGQRLLEDRLRFRQQTADQVQSYRYNDMAFRIFRNDALQKYRAQFDQAAQYVYLAAKAYDFDTNLRTNDSARPGSFFLNKIVRARTIGVIEGGEPQTGGLGDPGLADPMAGMQGNFAVLKPQLGFNNRQPDSKEFSLRSQLFRIQPDQIGNDKWREMLTRSRVANLLALPEFRRHCLFEPTLAQEPGLVIPFATTIDQNLNFFTWPADAAGDSGFNPTAFTTKVRSVRVSFTSYSITGGSGLRADPRVYLVPIGTDILRSPRTSPIDSINYTREWRIQDQWLPTPFAISDKTDSRLASVGWIPAFGVGEASASFPEQGQNLFQLAVIRAHPSFDAYHDSLAGLTGDEPQFQSARLIGRSVWNTQWLLVIPAVNLRGGTAAEDREEGLQRFINGALVGGQRDGYGVNDILIRFNAYAYAGR